MILKTESLSQSSRNWQTNEAQRSISISITPYSAKQCFAEFYWDIGKQILKQFLLMFQRVNIAGKYDERFCEH